MLNSRRSIRHLQRYSEIVAIFARHGFGFLFNHPEPGPRFRLRFRRAPQQEVPRDADNLAVHFRQALEEAGPTFVKFGQILSTRPDVIPEAYCEAFTKLQDDVGALPFAEIEAELDKSLGPDWRDRVDVDEEPLATASIAQVHTGRLKDGTRVVLKVQRPGIARIIRSDLNILYFLARRLLAAGSEHGVWAALGDPESHALQ